MIENVSYPLNDKFKFHISVRKPSNEMSIDNWKRFHAFIKETPICIGVNTLFHDIENHFDDEKYLRNLNCKYYFWFKTEEDSQLFFKQWDEILKELTNAH
jgi:hypothetical protein